MDTERHSFRFVGFGNALFKWHNAHEAGMAQMPTDNKYSTTFYCVRFDSRRAYCRISHRYLMNSQNLRSNRDRDKSFWCFAFPCQRPSRRLAPAGQYKSILDSVPALNAAARSHAFFYEPKGKQSAQEQERKKNIISDRHQSNVPF